MTAFTPKDLTARLQAEQDAPPATVTIAYASGTTYRFEVRDETDADDLLHLLTRTWAPIFTPLP